MLPRPGRRVAVLELDRWLEGTVDQANEDSGEFLVDFDDEAEVLLLARGSRCSRCGTKSFG